MSLCTRELCYYDKFIWRGSGVTGSGVVGPDADAAVER